MGAVGFFVLSDHQNVDSFLTNNQGKEKKKKKNGDMGNKSISSFPK